MAGRLEMVRVNPADVAGLYGADLICPAIAFLGLESGQPICIGGLVWGDGEKGRCTLWFDYGEDVPKRVWAVIRWAKRLLRYAAQVGEKAVYAGLDETQPNAERLIKVLGFRPFEERDGIKVYVWERDDG